MRKKPYMTNEYFNMINDRLNEQGKIPDILDYSLASNYTAVEMLTYEFDLEPILQYGGNEGIYLNIYIRYYDKVIEDNVTRCLGTYKTLITSDEAMYALSKLLADWVIENWNYVNDNIDDFTWEGYQVTGINGDKRSSWECITKEAAEKRKNTLFEKYQKVVVRNNRTRKEKIYTR